MIFPDIKYLKKTGSVDYYNWNYKFPIKYIQRYRFKQIIKLLKNNTLYDSMLEVGTGSGIFIPELKTHTKTLYASDIHSEYDHIKKMCEEMNIKDVYLSQQNIEMTSFEDHKFDVVIAVSVLEFVKDIQKALDEIKRILKNDGIFITICPMESSFLDKILSFYTSKKPSEEFGDARKKVTSMLEQNFIVEKKGYMVPIIGKWFPVYTFYKLRIKK
jgi:ubiquinone/menaquinone biosynthesis C-methylase UbiE